MSKLNRCIIYQIVLYESDMKSIRVIKNKSYYLLKKPHLKIQNKIHLMYYIRYDFFKKKKRYFSFIDVLYITCNIYTNRAIAFLVRSNITVHVWVTKSSYDVHDLIKILEKNLNCVFMVMVRTQTPMPIIFNYFKKIRFLFASRECLPQYGNEYL